MSKSAAAKKTVKPRAGEPLHVAAPKFGTKPAKSALPPTSPSPDLWLSQEDVEKHLRLSGGRVYSMVRAGDLQAYHVGRRRFFKRADVEALLQPRPVQLRPRRKVRVIAAAKKPVKRAAKKARKR